MGYQGTDYLQASRWLAAIVALLCTGMLSANAAAASSNEPLSITYQMQVQRAAEAAAWAMPAVSVYDIELSIQRDLAGHFGDVVYFSKPMTARHGFLTANDVTP